MSVICQRKRLAGPLFVAILLEIKFYVITPSLISYRRSSSEITPIVFLIVIFFGGYVVVSLSLCIFMH